MVVKRLSSCIVSLSARRIAVPVYRTVLRALRRSVGRLRDDPSAQWRHNSRRRLLLRRRRHRRRQQQQQQAGNYDNVLPATGTASDVQPGQWWSVVADAAAAPPAAFTGISRHCSPIRGQLLPSPSPVLTYCW